jgi:glycosyltransferase involved in cell wall biosynthesis
MRQTDITIAVTVYDRRRYIAHAIDSALSQNLNVPVVVVEDRGPDEGLREHVLAQFGSRISYVRNPRRRGLIDNWNACIELCPTPWLCILHDDDILEPTFVASMLELATAAPQRALYYGRWNVIDERGAVTEPAATAQNFSWSEPSLVDWATHNRASFAGQLFNVAAARELGGFRPHSQYSGDWDMWFRLAYYFGAAATDRVVANFREHISHGRGTTRADVSGRRFAYVNMQRKRNFALLGRKQPGCRFDRRSVQHESPLPSRWLLLYSGGFSPPMLRYNAGLLLISKPPHRGYAIFQQLVRVFSWRLIKLVSQLSSIFTGLSSNHTPSSSQNE